MCVCGQFAGSYYQIWSKVAGGVIGMEPPYQVIPVSALGKYSKSEYRDDTEPTASATLDRIS